MARLEDVCIFAGLDCEDMGIHPNHQVLDVVDFDEPSKHKCFVNHFGIRMNYVSGFDWNFDLLRHAFEESLCGFRIGNCGAYPYAASRYDILPRVWIQALDIADMVGDDIDVDICCICLLYAAGEVYNVAGITEIIENDITGTLQRPFSVFAASAKQFCSRSLKNSADMKSSGWFQS